MGYTECVRDALSYERHFRDLETYYEERNVPRVVANQISSGTIIIVHDGGGVGVPDYDVFWLSGPNAELFQITIVDDDTVASNGYSYHVVTARPLPFGVYRFFDYYQASRLVPCNFRSLHQRLEYRVTVTAPESTLHEAFFDPVTLGPGVGVEGTSGVFSATDLTVDGTSTSILGLKWYNDQVVLSWTSHTDLEGYALEFIELDGSIGLRLAGLDATEDAMAKTLTWAVTEQPWHDGDQLMLRIR